MWIMNDIRGNELMIDDEVAFTENTSTGLKVGKILGFFITAENMPFAKVRATRQDYLIGQDCIALIPPIDSNG